MTPTTDNTSRVRRVQVHADGTATVWTTTRSGTDDRHDYPAEQAHLIAHYLSREPHVRMLDLIEAGLPPHPGWTRSRSHWNGFAVLSLRRGEAFINILVTRSLDLITLAAPWAEESRAFDIEDAEGVNGTVTAWTDPEFRPVPRPGSSEPRGRCSWSPSRPGARPASG